ncbi:hypothetical protein MMC22_005627 [Lobaria immixta]|nr:hypothetical protein [Lobaria immixta]
MALSLQVQVPSIKRHIVGKDSDTKECAICPDNIRFMCTSCKSTGYCSAECKDTDWPSHKVLCHQFQSHLAEEPIGHDAVPVVFFQPSAPRPSLVWMTAEQIGQCDIKLRLESGSDALGRTTVGGINPIRQRPYRRPIVLVHDPHHFQRGIKNHSVESITGSAGETKWRGRVMAMLPCSSKDSRDRIDMRDLRELADFFKSYKLDDIHLGLLRDGIKKNIGVRINCLDDMRTHSLQQYTSIGIPKAHPIYLEPMSCDISLLIGLPIKTFKYVSRSDLCRGENDLAAHLHRCGDVNSPAWGFPPQKWLTNARSVLVVRCDGKDLLPEHAEVLCKFCDDHFRNIFSLETEAHAYRSGSQKERQQAFTERATRKGFEEFFERYRSSKARGIGRWRHLPTPYEM